MSISRANAAASQLLPPNLPPVIGAWSPGALTDEEARDAATYRDFLDIAAKHSAYTLLTLAIRKRHDSMPMEWWKNAVAYAKKLGFKVILEVDIRSAVSEFKAAHPNELQERLKLQEFAPSHSDQTYAEIEYAEINGGAFGRYPPNSIRLERVYAYKKNEAGIESDTVEDITTSCSAEAFPFTAILRNHDYPAQKLRVTIPSKDLTGRHTICVIAKVTLDCPDPFSPNYTRFETEMVKRFSDLPLDGLMKDECGIPTIRDANFKHDCLWYSRFRSEAYAERTGGRDMVRDSLLMCFGEQGRDGERQGVINHYMDMTRAQITKIGENHYRNAKETFGPNAFVGVHETVFPYPDVREFERNGLNWWTARRDFAQTDETTPYCCRTSLAKKFGRAVWYNQWYAPNREAYEKRIWSYALAGGRMNFHPLFGSDTAKMPRLERLVNLMRGHLQIAACRIGLLDYISETPLDCPVAVIFGHAAAMNWAGPAFENVGMELSDAFWRAGFYADLIPSSELNDPALRVDDDGSVWYGRQRYSAVVLCNPQFENPTTAAFFNRAAKGNAILARLGDWTLDSAGNAFDGNATLSSRVTAFSSAAACADATIDKLRKSGLKPQTPATVCLPRWFRDTYASSGTSMALGSSGANRLIDGTLLIIAGEHDVSGDPIQQNADIDGHEVVFDAVGVGAARLDANGDLNAMAAGGLKRFVGGGLTIELPERLDLAMWRIDGHWHGVVQGFDGPIPDILTDLTKDWLRLSIPTPLE